MNHVKVFSFLCVGFAAAATAFAYSHYNISSESALDYVLISAAAFLSGCFLGWLFFRFLGNPGIVGFITSIGAAYLITVLGGFMAGTIILPGIGSMGGLIAASTFFLDWQILVVWILSFGIAHIAISAAKNRDLLNE